MLRTVASESARARTMPRRSPLTSVTCALDIATSVPVPMAMPTSAARQRRRVVDAVAGHRDLAAFGLQPVDELGLVLRPDLAVHLVDAECRATASAVVRPSPVAMTMRSPAALQARDRLRRRLLDRVGHRDEAGERAVHGQEHRRSRRRGADAPRSLADDSRRRPRPRASARCCRAPARALDLAADADAGCPIRNPRPASARPRRRASATIAARADARCPGPGWRRAAAPRLGECRRRAIDVAKRGPPFGQRAGLVDDQRVDVRSFSIASASRNSMPACAARPVATMIDIGVASPSAQGQAMISTATALTHARRSSDGSGPNKPQTQKGRQRHRQHRQHEPEARPRSAMRCIGARERCACATSCTICDSTVSAPTRSARITSAPLPLIVAPISGRRRSSRPASARRSASIRRRSSGPR